MIRCFDQNKRERRSGGAPARLKGGGGGGGGQNRGRRPAVNLSIKMTAAFKKNFPRYVYEMMNVPSEFDRFQILLSSSSSFRNSCFSPAKTTRAKETNCGLRRSRSVSSSDLFQPHFARLQSEFHSVLQTALLVSRELNERSLKQVVAEYKLLF